MERSEDQNLALVREVLITEPYRFKARSRTTESEKVGQQIADNLNSDNRLLTPIIPLSFPRRNLFFFRETGVIAGSTNFSSNKRSLRYQSSKTSRVFLKDVMELKHERITLSSPVRRALHSTCWILICFSHEGGRVLAPGFLRSLYRRVQGILRSLMSKWVEESAQNPSKNIHYTRSSNMEVRAAGEGKLKRSLG